jgi:hypothetical protein
MMYVSNFIWKCWISFNDFPKKKESFLLIYFAKLLSYLPPKQRSMRSNMIETAVEAPGEAQAKQLKNHRLSIPQSTKFKYIPPSS